MDVQEKSKKRELIKTIAIIFLIIMLLLTFFSQTIMNHSLPEVATQAISSGTINAKIRGSGTVSANETYEVVINQTREVRSVCVKTGDTVAEGDLLFVLGDMESQEMKDAQEALQTAEINYQKQILTLSKTYAGDDLTVKNIRLDLQKAISDRDTNAVTDAEISYAKGDIATAKNQQTQVELLLAELQALQTGNEAYTEAKAKVDELTSKTQELETALKGYEDDLEKLENGESLDKDRAVQDAKAAYDRAQTKWESDWLAYISTIQELISNYVPEAGRISGTPHTFSSNEQKYIEAYLTEAALDYSSSATQPGGGDSGEEAAYAEVDRNDYQRYKTAYDTLLADQNAVDTAAQAYQRAQEDQSAASGTIQDQRLAIERKRDEADSELSTVQRQLRDAQNTLDAAVSANAQLKEQIKVYESLKREQEVNITELEEKLKELEEKKAKYDAAVETISAKQRELESALSGKDIDKKMNNLDLEAMRLDIEKQKELIAKYQQDTVETEIRSKVSGVIKTINATAGKDTVSGEAMATIDVVDRGFTIKISVTNEQAKQVKVGDTAEVSNYYWGNDITATLEAITSDPESGGQKKMLVFRVTGEIEAGTTINLSIGQRSANFDTIVPKSALREDTNGNFVLVVSSKSTPLGNRYTAVRADVEVLAQDDNNAAVSGLAPNDYVITTSSKPLDPGTQVRMVENP